jgi:hypothetical protein
VVLVHSGHGGNVLAGNAIGGVAIFGGKSSRFWRDDEDEDEDEDEDVEIDATVFHFELHCNHQYRNEFERNNKQQER